ncbi:MAG: hypothetical protein WC460_06810 [Patescibacteria group bacterium]
MTKIYRIKLSELRKTIKEQKGKQKPKLDAMDLPYSLYSLLEKFSSIIYRATRDDSIKDDVNDSFKQIYDTKELRRVLVIFNEHVDQPDKDLYRILHNVISRYDIEQIGTQIQSLNPQKFKKFVDMFK